MKNSRIFYALHVKSKQSFMLSVRDRYILNVKTDKVELTKRTAEEGLITKQNTHNTIPLCFHHAASTLKQCQNVVQNSQGIPLVSQILVSQEICRLTVSAYLWTQLKQIPFGQHLS